MNPGQLITHFRNANGRGGQTKIGAYFAGYEGRHSPLSFRPGESGLGTRGLKCASNLFKVCSGHRINLLRMAATLVLGR